jgi:hypothetical protein
MDVFIYSACKGTMVLAGSIRLDFYACPRFPDAAAGLRGSRCFCVRYIFILLWFIVAQIHCFNVLAILRQALHFSSAPEHVPSALLTEHQLTSSVASL